MQSDFCIRFDKNVQDLFFLNMKWQSLLSKLAAFGTVYIWGIITISGFISSHNCLYFSWGCYFFKFTVSLFIAS